MEFPNNETKLLKLASDEVAGLSQPDTPFPDPPVPPAQINATVALMTGADARIAVLQGQISDIAIEKGGYRGTLRKQLRDNIDYAEGLVGPKSPLLRTIGWAPEAEPTALQPPGQCGNFTLLSMVNNTLEFDWMKPRDGGKVAGYKLYRRVAGTIKWVLEDAIAGNLLRDQETDFPPGTWEVAVTAWNNAGEGPMSNSVTVTVAA